MENLVGNKYNKLTVLSFDRKENKNKHNRYFWNCLCDCGVIVSLNVDNFKSGKTSSCGCYHKQQASKASKKHGGTGTIEYGIWENMKNRCLLKTNPAYSNYGAKGITICDEWLNYKNFINDMGRRPSNLYSIDRINNNLGYFKENCRWATKIEQNRNRSNCVLTLNTQNGIYYDTITEAAESLNINRSTLVNQLKGIHPNKTNFIII